MGSAFRGTIGKQIASYTGGHTANPKPAAGYSQYVGSAVQKPSPMVDKDVQLAASAPESSSKPGHGVKFVLYILVGLSLPAAISFVKAISTALRKPSTPMQEAGQHLLA